MSNRSGPFSEHIMAIQEAASELISRSWAESFFGNISILLDVSIQDPVPIRKYSLKADISELEGKVLVATRTLSTMREVAESPEKAIGIYIVEKDDLSLLFGEGPPTSEIDSHLLCYAAGRGSAVIHCHTDRITDIPDELYIQLPEGCSLVGEIEPGSLELAAATARAMEDHHTVIWKGHGAISMGKDLRSCLVNLKRLDDFLMAIGS